MIDPINTLGDKEFDKELHKKYLTHIDINNLKGMEIELYIIGRLGELLLLIEAIFIVLLPELIKKN